jgi:hypothetical protein
MKDIIVHLNKEQTREERRKLLANDVYVLFHDNLEQLHKYGLTALSKVEVFVSAENFARLLLSLPNIEEGIDDELDDLEEEAEGENDAMIISVLAACLICAQRDSLPAFDWEFAAKRILARWDEHELLDPMLQAAAKKEEERWMEGKRIDLLTCELKESLENDNYDGARAVVSDIVEICEGLPAETVEKILFLLMALKGKYDHAFDAQINRLWEKLNEKTTTQATQVNVGPGGTNIQKVKNFYK